MNPIENLETLIDAVEAQPEELFSLLRYKQPRSCGTLFCTLGLAATMPEFQEQGLEIFQRERGGAFDVTINDRAAWHEGVADEMFGPEAFSRLFEPADCGSMDASLGYFSYRLLDGRNEDEPNMTDKELALKRLNKQLALLKANNEN